MAVLPLPNVIEAPEGSDQNLAEAFVKIQQNFEALMQTISPAPTVTTDSAGNITNITNVTNLSGVTAVGDSLQISGGGSTLNAKRVLLFTFDGGANAVTAGSRVVGIVPWNCTVVRWTLFGEPQGSAVVEVYHDATTSPDNLNSGESITGGDDPELASDSETASTNLVNWLKNLTAEGYIVAQIASASTLTKLVLAIEVVDR